MRILISSLNSAAWLAEALAAEARCEVHALHASCVNLGDFGTSTPQPVPGAAHHLHTLPVFPRRPYTYSLYQRGLSRFLKRLQPDVIYHLGEPSELNTAQVVHAARRQCPQARLVLFSFENVRHDWSGLPRCLRGMAQRYVLPRLDWVAACSNSARIVLETDGFPPERIRIVPQAVDDSAFAPQPDPALRRTLCADDGFLIGYIGRLVPEKGVDVLLRALAELPSQCVLAVVGTVREEEPLRALAAELGVADRVRWLGWVDRWRLAPYESTFDAIVLPSRGIPTWQEQFGAVLVEAMYCETAVVGSSSGAIPEVIGDTGLVFPEEDAVALAGCLRQLQDDAGLRRRLAVAGRERALREFSIPAYVQKLLALFDEALQHDK
ncbi:MAG: glycosyltransferase family 4 protein [Armatimonadia bacterium]